MGGGGGCGKMNHGLGSALTKMPLGCLALLLTASWTSPLMAPRFEQTSPRADIRTFEDSVGVLVETLLQA